MKKQRGYRSIAAAIAAVALLVAGMGAWYGLQPPPAEAREPSIAVLPFANMSGDPAQDYLGAGIPEDIITMLSYYPTLRVVSRTSSFVYDKPVKIQQVGEDLNVNYVLEGSAHKTGDNVRVTAQLIDALTGEHVWADRYDEQGSDLALLHDDVANKLWDARRTEGRGHEHGSGGSLEQIVPEPGEIRLFARPPAPS